MKTTNKPTIKPEDFKRVKNDAYGNPRYVIWYGALAGNSFGDAVAIAKRHGGTAYRGKDFGGGIVFVTYSLDGLCDALNAEVGNA